MVWLIKNKKILKEISIISIFCCLFATTYANSELNVKPSILSPTPGVWSNKQALVVSVPDGCEVYYSLLGTDPLESGFAYDGPVLLDITGDVTLKVVSVYPNNVRYDESVSFTINENPSISSEFLTQTSIPIDSYLIQFDKASSVNIPSSMTYSLSDNRSPFIPGTNLSIDIRNSYSSFVPLIVNFENNLFRFMIAINGNSAFAELPIPVSPVICRDWEYVSFTSNKRIQYSIDGTKWHEAKNEFYVDRSTDHTVFWQYIPDIVIPDSDDEDIIPQQDIMIDPSLRGKILKHSEILFPKTDSENVSEIDDLETEVSPDTEVVDENIVYYEIYSFILPAKPSFVGTPANSLTNKSVTLSLDRPGFIFRCLSDNFSPEYTKSMTVDCLYGSSVNADIQLEVYYAGILQGKINTSFIIDKEPPVPPVFISSSPNRYSRESVLLQIQGEGSVYYNFLKSVEAPNGFTTFDISKLTSDISIPKNATFKNLVGQALLLSEKSRTAVFYSIAAFCSDSAGNKSQSVFFDVVVDPINFYIDSSFTDNDTSDGSPSFPLAAINSRFLLSLKTTPFVRIHLSGDFQLKSSIVLQNECEIIGKTNARISFLDGANLLITGNTVSITGCSFESIENNISTNKTPSYLFRKALISVVNSNLSISDCEFSSVYQDSGSVFSLDSANLTLKNTGLTVKAGTYATVISAENSKIDAISLRSSSVAQTALIFSLDGGSVNLQNSVCNITASLSRVAELSGVKYSFVNNRFISNNLVTDSQKQFSGTKSIWTDNKSIMISNSENTEIGF